MIEAEKSAAIKAPNFASTTRMAGSPAAIAMETILILPRANEGTDLSAALDAAESEL